MFLNDAHDAPEGRSAGFTSALTQSLPRIAPLSIISLLYAMSLSAFYQQGLISGASFIGVAGTVLATLLVFYGIFLKGWNQRFTEPDLVLPQILAAMLLMLGATYFERATQIALVPFMLIAFSFGVFRLSTASLLVLSVSCLGAYLGVILLRAHTEGYAFGFRTDFVQWLVLAFTLPGVVLVARRIQNLRQLLCSTRDELQHYEEKSLRDELTGLYNRRQLMLELEHAKMRANRHDVSFSLCLIDVDHFKEINDTNGHLAGDAVLKRFARLVRESVRETDTLGRYGGDEFLQILPDTDLTGAIVHAERLRTSTHVLDLEKVIRQRKISLSIGVAQYHPGETVNDLIARADAALYRAKQLGRNRIEWAAA
jgi:diguanylate cyclase